MKYANLHLHSVYSDGIRTPQELCQLAAQKGYRAIALTDHETTAGTAEMREAAQEAGLEFINGIEAFVKHGGRSDFHMVGLGFDPEHPRMRAYTDRTERLSVELTIHRIAHCTETGAFSGVTWEDVQARFPHVRWFCNEHVFKVLQEQHGMTDADYWNFLRAFNRGQLVQESSITEAAEVIDIIRAAGGISILAHPTMDQLQHLPALAALGLGGVETDHPAMTAEARLEATRLAAELGLCTSGGTDHYGVLGNIVARVPGAPDVSNGASREEYERIRERLR